MLTVTEDAATLICTLIRDAERSGTTGLRIIVHSDHQSLAMSLADGPSPADDIVETDKARVFLSAPASQRLSERTLRAALSVNRSSFFLG